MARLLACVLLVGCGSGGAAATGSASGSGSGSATGSSASAPKKSTGFSASLSAELGSGSGSAKTASPPTPEPKGSAAAKGSDTKVVEGKTPEVKTPEVKTPEVKTPEVKTPEVKVAASGSGSGSAKTEPAKPAPVKMTPDLAAIKFELLPNWDRDVAEPATFSLAVKLPKSNETKTFIFHYGYEDASAPVDRAEYMKWLSAQHLLDVTTERQRGAAWYLENKTAFRYLINYGGKRLICYGSQYRDSTHDPMGDLRDEVLLQAKKICESLQL